MSASAGRGALPRATSAPAGHGALPRATSAAPLGGINISASSPGEIDRQIAIARALHAQLVRIEAPWSQLEPLGSGRIDPAALAYTDRVVSDAAANGIRVIVLVDRTPCWASSAPAALLRACSPTRASKANAWPPGNPADYAALVAYLARRYGTRLAAIEIWNEPDQINQLYFAGPEKPRRYAAILRAAYTAIKQANPNVLVLGGSLVGSNGVFLRELYAAGIKGYYDGLAVHFYTLTLGALRAIHETQLASGDGTPLWLDEFGWSTCWPRYRIQQEQACVTRQVQAANLSDMYRSLARTPYVAAIAVYKLQGSRQEDFGLLSESGARKPAFAALAGALVSPLGKVDPVTLALRARGGRVVASGSGPVGDFMELEAFRGGVLRYRALFTLDRFNRFAIALPAALGTRGLRVHVGELSSGLVPPAEKTI
jgi:Cellulase (glycosyl hydrolase family 5)